MSTKATVLPYTPCDKLRLRSVMKNNWYVFYTAPRAEKVVCQELSNRNYEVFLPTIKTVKKYKCRHKKLIDQVIFPGYIFVNTIECELHKIKSVPKVVAYIHCAGKPSIIPLKVIKGIEIMLGLNEDISVENSFCEGEKVRIISGPLIGYEGILIKQNGKNRFGIQLKEIERTIYINLNTSLVEKLKKS